MRHMNKTQRIHAGYVNGLLKIREHDREASYVESAKNNADIFTKQLEKTAFYQALRRLGVKTLQDFQNLSEQQKCYREYRAAATAAAARSRAIPQKAPAESDFDTGHSEIDLFDSDEDQNAYEKDF